MRFRSGSVGHSLAEPCLPCPKTRLTDVAHPSIPSLLPAGMCAELIAAASGPFEFLTVALHLTRPLSGASQEPDLNARCIETPTGDNSPSMWIEYYLVQTAAITAAFADLNADAAAGRVQCVQTNLPCPIQPLIYASAFASATFSRRVVVPQRAAGVLDVSSACMVCVWCVGLSYAAPIFFLLQHHKRG